MKQEHTPTPWRAMEMGSEGARLFQVTTDKRQAMKHIADVMARDTLTDFANAAFIVRAVNAHDELVEALEDARNVIKHSVRRDVFTYKQHILDKIDTALARVEGSES